MLKEPLSENDKKNDLLKKKMISTNTGKLQQYINWKDKQTI